MTARLTLIAALVLTACKNGEDGDDGTDTLDEVTPGAFLAGTWAPGDDGEVFAADWLGEIDYVTFTPAEEGGSTGVIGVYGELGSGVQVCERALYDAGSEGFLTLVSYSVFSGLRGFLMSGDADGFTLTSELDEEESFTPVADGLPESAVCQDAEEQERASFDLDYTSFGNLLWDGASLRVCVDGGAVTVDVGSGSVGASTAYSASYDHLLTLQGNDAWGHCGCGGSEEIVRSSPGGAHVDTIDTADLGAELGVRLAAWDGTHLWVAGYSYDEGETLLLKIDSDAEPDVLVSRTSMGDLAAEAMVWHDGELYAFAHDSIVRLDAGTARAEETWKLPPDLAGYGPWGMTSDGSSLYVAYETWPDLLIVEVEL